jgi:hypothetical protein
MFSLLNTTFLSSFTIANVRVVSFRFSLSVREKNMGEKKKEKYCVEKYEKKYLKCT